MRYSEGCLYICILPIDEGGSYNNYTCSSHNPGDKLANDCSVEQPDTLSICGELLLDLIKYKKSIAQQMF